MRKGFYAISAPEQLITAKQHSRGIHPILRHRKITGYLNSILKRLPFSCGFGSG
jgi:hypothetical protein